MTNPPLLVLHVGMGKTGTTSIQAALQHNDQAGNLARQNCKYLGSYFDFLGDSFPVDSPSLGRLLESGNDGVKKLGLHLANFILCEQAESGCKKFIFSNEFLNCYSTHLGPLLDVISESGISLKIIITFRDPSSWLHSAYNQWGVKHKSYKGRLLTFSDMAPLFMRQYSDALGWFESYGDLASPLVYNKGKDIVRSFAKALMIELEPLENRALESPPAAELLLRAMFNDGFANEALPLEFDCATQLEKIPSNFSLDYFFEAIFERSSAEGIVEDYSSLFERVSETAGIEFAHDDSAWEGPMSKHEVRNLLIDQLLWMVLNQASRLKVLEHKLLISNEK